MNATPHIGGGDNGHGILRGLFFLAGTILFWAVSPLFVRYFQAFYDPWTQNAFRYAAAAAILLGWCLLTRTPLGGLSAGQWRQIGLVVAANLLMQSAYAWTYAFIYPSVGTLLGSADILFLCLISFIFFSAERRAIRSPLFILGTVLSVAGLFFVVWGQDPDVLAHLRVTRSDYWTGVAVGLSYAFFVALYATAIRPLVRSVSPIVGFTHVSWLTTLGLTVLMFVFGRPSDLWGRPAQPFLLMLVSALVAIVLAHSCYYAALRDVSPVVSSTVLRMTPVITCGLSLLVYRDRLAPLQVAGGCGVIAGAALATQALVGGRRRPAAAAAVGGL
jgi:drug/metabolite transporter (DMT)-like permease